MTEIFVEPLLMAVRCELVNRMLVDADCCKGCKFNKGYAFVEDMPCKLGIRCKVSTEGHKGVLIPDARGRELANK